MHLRPSELKLLQEAQRQHRLVEPYLPMIAHVEQLQQAIEPLRQMHEPLRKLDAYIEPLRKMQAHFADLQQMAAIASAAARERKAHRACERREMSRPRSSRATRRPGATSSTSSSDPGDDDGESEGDGDGAAARHLHLVPDLPPHPARYTFACLTAEQRGADVEQVVA